MTLASFRPKDAFKYWNALGLTVASNRIHVVNIDGGPGAPSDESGSGETTLDVEQSGGIAPGAKIIVYQAPNTNQGFLDLFAAAVEANVAETLSTSWGTWEWFDNLQNAPVTDPLTGKTVSSIVAVHEQLLRAAIQGQTVFAAAGDGGAYDVNNDLGCYGPYSPAVPTSCSATLSVDNPASDTAITAGGGTTTPAHLQLCLNSECTPPFYNIDIPHERVWGWDYFDDFCNFLGLNPISCGIFAAGGGGGVSVIFGTPSYQATLPWDPAQPARPVLARWLRVQIPWSWNALRAAISVCGPQRSGCLLRCRSLHWIRDLLHFERDRFHDSIRLWRHEFRGAAAQWRLCPVGTISAEQARSAELPALRSRSQWQSLWSRAAAACSSVWRQLVLLRQRWVQSRGRTWYLGRGEFRERPSEHFLLIARGYIRASGVWAINSSDPSPCVRPTVAAAPEVTRGRLKATPLLHAQVNW